MQFYIRTFIDPIIVIQVVDLPVGNDTTKIMFQIAMGDEWNWNNFPIVTCPNFRLFVHFCHCKKKQKYY